MSGHKKTPTQQRKPLRGYDKSQLLESMFQKKTRPLPRPRRLACWKMRTSKLEVEQGHSFAEFLFWIVCFQAGPGGSLKPRSPNLPNGSLWSSESLLCLSSGTAIQHSRFPEYSEPSQRLIYFRKPRNVHLSRCLSRPRLRDQTLSSKYRIRAFPPLFWSYNVPRIGSLTPRAI